MENEKCVCQPQTPKGALNYKHKIGTETATSAFGGLSVTVVY